MTRRLSIPAPESITVILFMALAAGLTGADLPPRGDAPRLVRRSQGTDQDPRALPVHTSDPGEFSGTVVDRLGNPVKGVVVHAWDWHPGYKTTTDAEGAFRLTRLDPEERIEVRFIKEGYAPYTIIKQPLGSLIDAVVLDDQTCFEGVVTGPDSKPVPDALIRANQGPKQADGVTITTIWTETRSDPDGRYRLRVQDDTYDLQVTTSSGLVARLPKLTIGPKEVAALDLPLQQGVVFRAHVVDSLTGEGVKGVVLNHWQHPGVEGKSNATGELEIRGIIPGAFEFDVKAPGCARWWSEDCKNDWERRKIGKYDWQRNLDGLTFSMESGMKPVTIVMEKAVRVRGRILDPDGHPVAGATAAPALTGTGNSLTGDTRFSVKSMEDGTYEMQLPASGDRTYNLVAHDGAYQQWRHWANGVSDDLKTTPGQQINDFNLKLTRPAVVRSRVLDLNGAPVANREVRAAAADLRENRYYDPTTRTLADGSFEIRFIRAGKTRVQVAPFWLLASEAPGEFTRDVELSEGQTLELPEFTIPPGRQ